MSDEFDDDTGDSWTAEADRTVRQPRSPHAAGQTAAPRLVARLYASTDQDLRARMLNCLTRPLGPLGLVAVASGAFACFLARAATPGGTVVIEEAARFTREQIFELARFAEQVNPEVLQQLAGLFSDGPLGMAGVSAAALALLARTFQRPHDPSTARPLELPAGADPGNDRLRDGEP
jgi:hypothetical protein